MAWEQELMDISCVAAADLSAKQFYIVKIVAGGGAEDAPSVNVPSGAGDKPLGILQNKPKSGETARVRVMGVSPLSADGALTQDATYGTSGDGQGIAKTADADLILGRVLRGVSNAGEMATVTVNGLSLIQRAS